MTSTSRSFKPSCTSGFAPLARANSWCARCSGVSKLCQQQVSSSEAAKDLLNWLADQRGAIRTAVEVDESPSGAGRRLLAGRNFAADEVLMSVPFTSVFVDIETDADTYVPWSARMALRLLQHKSLCLKADPDDAIMCPWVAALPRQVILPHIHFSDADMVALQDPETVQEVQAMRLSHEACFQELEEDLEVVGCNRKDFDWAVSVLHSRCFIQGPQSIHMTVPGVDMANHSFSPNATVRCVYSPEASQGRQAEEDVCQPPPAQPAMFQLLSGPDGVRNGEERQLALLQARLGPGDWTRLVVTAAGFDGRLIHAAQTLVHLHESYVADEQLQFLVPSLGALLSFRCNQMLSQLVTSIQQDVQQLRSKELNDNMRLAVQYRLSKKRILQHAYNASTRI
ncbi:hypothetical protein WJX79_003758 [Trebouxia sp. C0005]